MKNNMNLDNANASRRDSEGVQSNYQSMVLKNNYSSSSGNTPDDVSHGLSDSSDLSGLGPLPTSSYFANSSQHNQVISAPNGSVLSSTSTSCKIMAG